MLTERDLCSHIIACGEESPDNFDDQDEDDAPPQPFHAEMLNTIKTLRRA